METLKLIWLIIRRTHGDRILAGFFVFYVVASILLWVLDPELKNLGDALWLGINIATSIGLGDYTVVHPLARIVAVLLGIYGVIIAAFIPGLISSYYMEKIRVVADNTIEENYDDLMNLQNMSQEEKKKLADKIKEGSTK